MLLQHSWLMKALVRRYLAAVRSLQISLGLPDLRDQSSFPMLKRVQAGIQRARALSGSSSRTRLPITAAVLGHIGAQLESSSHSHKELLWAVVCTAFFGFFRLGELLHCGPVIASHSME